MYRTGALLGACAYIPTGSTYMYMYMYMYVLNNGVCLILIRINFYTIYTCTCVHTVYTMLVQYFKGTTRGVYCITSEYTGEFPYIHLKLLKRVNNFLISLNFFIFNDSVTCNG